MTLNKDRAELKYRKQILFRFFGFTLRIGIARNSPRNVARNSLQHQVHLRQVLELMRRFPALSAFYHSEVEKCASTCEALLSFINSLLPIIHPEAREPYIRNILLRLQGKVSDEDYRNKISREIAKSNLRSGVPERSRILESSPDHTPEEAGVRIRFLAEVAEFEKYYGSRVPLIKHADDWASIKGDVRGRSLAYFFQQRRDLVENKKILHCAPERELKTWLINNKSTFAYSYTTMDIAIEETDLCEDLTELRISDRSFDLIICHRVLEHVLDDKKALSELHRVLKPGGTLSISVPQSMQLPQTNEWTIPDESHDDHIRQYGRDFEEKLKNAGFKVHLENLLLQMSKEDHLKYGTYPMRFYSANRPK